jgi:hypothetical protein
MLYAQLLSLIIFFSLITPLVAWQKPTESKLVVVTVATSETDGFRRFRKSARHFKHDLHVFGMGQEWKGGNMETEVGLIAL